MEKKAGNFIEEFIEEDLAAGRYDHVKTRFPPEPNGFLHIGHVKALCIDFGIAQKYGGSCNLRFDDTNPTKEDTVFVEGIQNDIRWLGFAWDELHFASDFFERLYDIACQLIKKGVAYVDDQTPEQMRENRGTLTKPGVNSPYRDRTVEENLTCSSGCGTGSSPTAAGCCGPKSIWRLPTCSCGTQPCTASCATITTRPEISGASTPCTISSIPSRTPSKG